MSANSVLPPQVGRTLLVRIDPRTGKPVGSDLRARKVREKDFEDYDMILAMDWDNLSALQIQSEYLERALDFVDRRGSASPSHKVVLDLSEPTTTRVIAEDVADNVTDILIVGNLYAHNYERNPLFKGGVRGVIVNNLIFNPGQRADVLSFAQLWKREATSGIIIDVPSIREDAMPPLRLNLERLPVAIGMAASAAEACSATAPRATMACGAPRPPVSSMLTTRSTRRPRRRA